MTRLREQPNLNQTLRLLVGELEVLGPGVTAEQATEVLARAELRVDDVAPFIVPRTAGYSRQRVARTEHFEILVMTWRPGQGSGPHDHAGSHSAYNILQGTANETRYAQGPDSLVEPTSTRQLRTGEVGLDAGDVIHSVGNDHSSSEDLVSVHVYAPPIRELRRFTLRTRSRVPTDALVRRRSPHTPVVAIVGAGYSGAMVAVQLLLRATRNRTPLHLVILDPQASIAEGAAYRTANLRHLLNVPASGMSAWPDRPHDFLQWASHRDSSVGPYSFLPRCMYGEYLRATFLDAIAHAGPQVSVEIIRHNVDTVDRRSASGWLVGFHGTESIEAEVVVLATGHRPPVDPLNHHWSGSRARYIEDPWSSLQLTAIGKDESVCLLGTGLTALDALQSLGGSGRSAPVMAFSRRGLTPATHSGAPLAPIDPQEWLEPFLGAGAQVSTRVLTRLIRRAVRTAESGGHDWRQVIDGLRPDVARIWQTFPNAERARFLRHARAFWEVNRHRMAPTVAREVREAAECGVFKATAARVLSAQGAVDGVVLTLRRRGESVCESLRFDWVVNCTGPGSGREYGFPTMLARLIDAGHLEADPLGLGIRSTSNGAALVAGRVIRDLVLIGTLRKADLWESTAVPELREQAASAAEAIVRLIAQRENCSVGGQRTHAASDRA